jgi:hypothetical protein
MQLFELFATIGLKADEFNKGIKEAQGQAEGFSSKAAEVFKKVGEAAIAGLAIAATAVSGLAVKALQLGGELEQNLGGAEAVFGEYSDSIKEKAKDAYRTMGVSASDYMATANKMARLCKVAV